MSSSLTIKRYIHLFPFLFIIIPLLWSWYLHGFHQNHDKSDKIMFCKSNRTTIEPSSPLNYVGSSLFSNSHDSEDQVFCPGDYFGDLYNTYVTVKNCYLEMYHKEKLIWASKTNDKYAGHIYNREYTCALSLQRDGNLVLYRETSILANPGGKRRMIFVQWESQTNLNPVKTELRVQDKQIQVIQAFQDGTERLFSVGEDHPEFKEGMVKPRKIANKFVLKKSEDEDKTILRRNEYIGDLNGTHLILQSNCNLQLLNKDQILWSFAPYFRHEMGCVLDIDERHQVRISGINNKNGQRIMYFNEYDWSYYVIETLISFEDDQPMIIQTLKNGAELTFTARGGAQNNGLKLKRKPRQVAEKTLNISKDDDTDFKIERMDYIGNLTDLHLILGQNCDLILANCTQKLWELQPNLYAEPLMECSIKLERNGHIRLERQFITFYGGGENILTTSYDDQKSLTGYQLTLENNQLIITRQFANRPPDIYFAGSNTRGALFQIMTERSVKINHSNEEDRIMLKMGYIGDLNGVYAMLEENCNWVFYNKTQVMWESGTSRNKNDRYCVLILKRNGNVEIAHEWESQRENPFWSTQNLTINPEKQTLSTELRVDNDGLWLINTYLGGTVNWFKALEGTNSFIHMLNDRQQ